MKKNTSRSKYPDLSGVKVKIDSLLTKQLEVSKSLENLENNYLVKINELETLCDNRQERLAAITQNVQEDRYRKDKLKLLNRCIFQADLIRKTIHEYPLLREQIEDKEQYLLTQLNEIVTGLETTLQYEGISIRNFAKVGEKVNPEYQEVISVIETDDETKNNTIAEIVNPAYVWTLPYILKAKMSDSGEEIKTYKFLMQAEQVVAYKVKSK